MARPRKYNVTIPGLSCYLDSRTKRVYWRYKHPVTGKFHGLGTDEDEARQIATEANIRLAQSRLQNLLQVRRHIADDVAGKITVSCWAEKYLRIQERRFENGEIKTTTVRSRKTVTRVLVRELGLKYMDEVSVKDISNILEHYIEQGKSTMAQAIRNIAVDFFKESQRAGEVSPEFNPALLTRAPKVRIRRTRLDIETWQKIYDCGTYPAYLQRAMLLALLTGQRISDITKMKFSDIWDGYLHVQQEKTGARIAIPLSLRCEVLGLSLEEVINRCRDNILSPYILHHTRRSGSSERGDPITSHTLRTHFMAARQATGLKWETGAAPTFHEQRSLSERLYRKQGVDTRTLLGHKRQEMTDKYNDDRDQGWKYLVVKK